MINIQNNNTGNTLNTQLIIEGVNGSHNISEWVKEEIASINQSDINTALERAELFLTRDREDLNEEARIKEIMSDYGLEEAKQLIVDTLLEIIILIKKANKGDVQAYKQLMDSAYGKATASVDINSSEGISVDFKELMRGIKTS